ncbi:MAG: hypothetical protein PHU25_01835 [Deltaproteobacteria bacterium]|nr:hypothetical protein [Deltaproteobacteria bacterium]
MSAQVRFLGLLAAALAPAFAGCGAGQYGFSRYYVPLDDEESYDEQGKEYGYGDVTSSPSSFEGKLIAWFGVVEKVTQAPDGRYLIALSHRQHQERHLCDDDSSGSCRVTVHFKTSGGFSAIVALTATDTSPGLNKVQPGSLLRVFGKVRCKQNDEEQTVCEYDDRGGVLLDAVYYRQWPARYFVTTRAASTMRR